MSYYPTNQGPQDLPPHPLPPPAYSSAGTAVYYGHPTTVVVAGPQPPPPPPAPQRQSFYPRTTSNCLGMAQLFMGLVSLTGGIMALVYDASMDHTGVGIWCGVFYLIAGTVAMAAGCNPSDSLVTSTAVTSGLDIAFGLTEVAIAGVGLSEDVFCYEYQCIAWDEAAVAANCLMIGAGSWQMIFGMWLLAVSCQAVNNRSRSQVSAVPVTYVTGSSGAVLLPMDYHQDYYHQSYAAGPSTQPQVMPYHQTHQMQQPKDQHPHPQ